MFGAGGIGLSEVGGMVMREDGGGGAGGRPECRLLSWLWIGVWWSPKLVLGANAGCSGGSVKEKKWVLGGSREGGGGGAFDAMVNAPQG